MCRCVYIGVLGATSVVYEKMMDHCKRATHSSSLPLCHLSLVLAIPPMVTTAKTSITQPKNAEVYSQFCTKGDNVSTPLDPSETSRL